MHHKRNTNFAKYSHDRLYQMLHDGDESTARSAGDSWDGVGGRMHEQAGKLEAKLGPFREQWQGGAAEQYHLMISDLSTGLRRIGDTMFRMRDIAHDSADSLTKAKARMPAPVAVPDVSPAAMYLATTPVEVDPLASTQDVAALRQRQADAATEVSGYQHAVQASNSAHSQAVAVMNDLANEYVVSDDGIPVAPKAAGRTAVPVSEEEGGEWLMEETALESEVEPESEAGGPPVFGTMFTAGVAAAAAATAGRLGRTPKVPDWAKKDGKAEDKKAADSLAKGLGGGKLGGLGGGGGGVGNVPAPTAHAGMIGGPAAGQAAAALRAAAGAAGAGAAMMPMMPFLPFAPMGMGGANARRVPSWLTETEDVWGESAVITPPVLGEDPPEPRRGPTDFSY